MCSTQKDNCDSESLPLAMVSYPGGIEAIVAEKIDSPSVLLLSSSALSASLSESMTMTSFPTSMRIGFWAQMDCTHERNNCLMQPIVRRSLS